MRTNNNILVTIRCITYNHASYIQQALEGFLMQKTNFNYEILIHDDASTDGTTEIIKKYEKKYPSLIHPLYQKENQFKQKGFTNISKLLIQNTRGKYIAFCEGDDYWTDPYKLQKQISFLESHPEHTMCFHQGIIHYENRKIPDQIMNNNLEPRDYSGLEIYKNYRPQTCTVVMRSSVMNSIEYQKYLNSDIPFGDLPAFLACANLGKIHALTDSMAVYRKHIHGATIIFEKPDKRILRFAKGHLDLYKIFGDVYKDEAISIYVMEHINYIFKSYGSGKLEINLLLKILITHPLYTLKFLFQRIKFANI